MQLYSSSEEFLYNLKATTSSEAKRLWKKQIKEQWNYQCAYCGSEENLTIDHIVPRSKGGSDFSKNVVCSCNECNQEKSHNDWEEWYITKNFYDKKRHQKIKDWMNPDPPINLFSYRPRKNNAS